MTGRKNIDELYNTAFAKTDRNELLMRALESAANRAVIRIDAIPLLHGMYTDKCVIDPERNEITLLGLPLSDAVDEIAKRMPLVQVAKDDPQVEQRRMEEQVALQGSVAGHGQMYKRFVAESGGNEALGMAKYQQWCGEHGAKPGLKAAVDAAADAVARNGFVEGDLRAAGVEVSPWSAEGWSITMQGEVVKRIGLEKATAMAIRAGSKIGATRPSKVA